MNRLSAKYYYMNGDIVDCLTYHATTKLSLIDLLLEARDDSSFLRLEIIKK